MKLPPLNPHLQRTDVLKEKYRYGIWYGLVLGFGFAVFTWGVDAYFLSVHHGLLPWLKFVIGAVICMAVGAAAGWAAALSGKSLAAMLVWLITGSVFAWLAVHLPLTLLPRAMSLLEPALRELLHYEYFANFPQIVGVAYLWLGIFLAVAGILQVPLSDSAVFSTSIFGKLGPLLVVLILMSIAGSILDNGLFNQPLRDSTLAVDSTLQFILEHRGQEVDAAEARRMHTGAFRAVDASVTPDYRLFVSGYDSEFIEIHVLAKFERDWVECQVVYNQPISCKVVGNAP
ncbi:MAG: hypothetical protein AB1509_02540 [Chloroflexota bacterium]